MPLRLREIKGNSRWQAEQETELALYLLSNLHPLLLTISRFLTYIDSAHEGHGIPAFYIMYLLVDNLDTWSDYGNAYYREYQYHKT